jgi:hypothetical protein
MESISLIEGLAVHLRVNECNGLVTAVYFRLAHNPPSVAHREVVASWGQAWPWANQVVGIH